MQQNKNNLSACYSSSTFQMCYENSKNLPPPFSLTQTGIIDPFQPHVPSLYIGLKCVTITIFLFQNGYIHI